MRPRSTWRQYLVAAGLVLGLVSAEAPWITVQVPTGASASAGWAAVAPASFSPCPRRGGCLGSKPLDSSSGDPCAGRRTASVGGGLRVGVGTGARVVGGADCPGGRRCLRGCQASSRPQRLLLSGGLAGSLCLVWPSLPCCCLAWWGPGTPVRIGARRNTIGAPRLQRLIRGSH